MKKSLRFMCLSKFSVLELRQSFFALTLLIGINAQVFAIPTPPLGITSFTPDQAAANSVVVITGTDFGSSSDMVVYFGGVKALITEATPTTLSVIVPHGASYGSIEVLNTSTKRFAKSSKKFTPMHVNAKQGVLSDVFKPITGLPNIGSKPSNFAIGDFNSDGKPDLVVTNDGDNSISIYKNNAPQSGNPNYSLSETIGAGQNPQNVKLGDVNGDGKLDILVAAYNSTYVKIFLNYSTDNAILFSEGIDIPSNECPFYGEFIDIDGDGKLDIVLANKLSNTVDVFLNTSTLSELSFSKELALENISQPYVLSVGDLDGDNKPEIVAAGFGDSKILVYKNLSGYGDVNFSAPVELVATTPYGVILADLDSDGKLDVISSNLMGKSISIFRNITTEGGTLSFDEREDILIGKKVYAVAVGDLNGDGKVDLAVTNYYIEKTPIGDQQPEDVIQDPSGLVILKNVSTSGNIDFTNEGELLTGIGPTFVSINDINADGRNEIIAVNYEDNTLSIFTNYNDISVVRVNSTKANGTYTVGDIIDIDVEFNEVVNVIGTPKLSVALNEGNKEIDYIEGTGTKKLTFRYTIAENENTSDLNYSSSTALDVNGATVSGIVAGAILDFTLPNTGAANSLAGLKDIAINSSLPVAFNLFKASLINNNEVRLTWDTFSESNNSHFNIYSSSDGVSYILLRTVNGNATTSLPSYYSIIDATPVQGYNYYKIEQVDFNGTVTDLATQVIRVSLNNIEEVALYPNPTHDVVNVKFAKGVYTNAQLIDLNGRVLQNKIIISGDIAASFNVGDLKSAIYILKLSGVNKSVTKTFLKK